MTPHQSELIARMIMEDRLREAATRPPRVRPDTSRRPTTDVVGAMLVRLGTRLQSRPRRRSIAH